MIKYHYIIPYAVALILAFLLFKSCDRTNTLQDLNSAANDTLSQYRNKYNQQVTSIAEFTSEREKDFLLMFSQDTTIKALQSLVKSYRGKLQSATIASTETTDSGKTITVVRIDTVLINGKQELKPVYSSAWNETWSVGIIEAHWDSIHRNIKTRNEFTFTHGYKRNLFKKDVLKVEMTNLNPNTVTTELRSYSVSVPKKRFTVGVGLTYGWSVTTLKRDAVVGVNASFSLFRF